MQHVVRARCRRGRCRRKCLGDRNEGFDDRRLLGHIGSVDADGLGSRQRRTDVGRSVLERLHRRRRCDRLSDLPERLSDRHFSLAQLPARRPDLRDHLHGRRRGGRWVGERVGDRHAERDDVCLPGYGRPVDADGLGTSAVTQTSATLSWAASSDNVAVTGYRLFRGGSQVGTATTTSYGYTGLTCGTAYVLGVAAVDAAGNVSATATTNLTTAACPDTSAPSTPTGLAASAVGQTSATLSWTASSDNVAVTGYRVFRAGTQVGTTSSTTFTVTGLTCATTYTLGVAALDAAGNVSATATTSATTPACPDTSAPSTPAGLATSAVTQTAATLSWSASTDNVGVTGYRVFRSGTQVGTPTTTSFAFSGLTCGTSYTLGVAAVDAAGTCRRPRRRASRPSPARTRPHLRLRLGCRSAGRARRLSHCRGSRRRTTSECPGIASIRTAHRWGRRRRWATSSADSRVRPLHVGCGGC